MADDNQIYVPVLEVEQPIGKFYVGVMSAQDLLAISYADMRTIESDKDNYVGIQRKLNKKRVAEIADFVQSIDATFPTSVVLAIHGDCAELTSDGRLRVFEGVDSDTGEEIKLNAVASILDGQHRVEGLKAAGDVSFQVPVSIFVDADIADQAYIFATVNLAQTKVNTSLVYDLFDFAKARSPQKTAHEIAVALDRYEDSPFYQSIKRLGVATPGRVGELLAQATIVNGIIPLISKKPEQDRYDSAKGRKVSFDEKKYEETPLRRAWVDDNDSDIARVLLNYFSAVRKRWPSAWGSQERGHILSRTNGYRALIRLFKNIYLKERPSPLADSVVISAETFFKYFQKSPLNDGDFTIDRYPPGTSGETAMYKELREQLGV